MEKFVAYLWELMYFGVDIDLTLYFLRSARLGFVPPILFHILQNTSWYCFALSQKTLQVVVSFDLFASTYIVRLAGALIGKSSVDENSSLSTFWPGLEIEYACFNTLNISAISLPIIVPFMKSFLEKHQRKTNWIVLSHLQNQRGDRVNYPLCFHLSNLLQKVLNG